MNPVNIYAEITPNPKTMKFVADVYLVQANSSFEFKDPDDVKNSPLLERLFNFPFVQSIFVSDNFISVTKNDLVEWDDITLELREYIQDYLRKNNSLFTIENPEIFDHQSQHKIESEELYDEVVAQNETEQKIMDILEEYVKPAVAQDGGNIVFKSFNEGVLKVSMKGSCNGCPSSSVTLKSGIQQLFARMMPEVREVVED